ncbi:(2Fe-2S)-binding protein [Luteimonas panaciterrae]|uniref:(2Fe-2S)-binding protein n=1 Tax=Luteimonas panaciterrae TaxID=363885 RepID=UPI001CFA12FC|nr:(2Fe-2S)-binding protein [Luteimonas panaciterrae]
MYVCLCNGVTEREIRQAAQAGCGSMAELTMRTGCGATCGSCVSMACEILDETRNEAPRTGGNVVPFPLVLSAA